MFNRELLEKLMESEGLSNRENLYKKFEKLEFPKFKRVQLKNTSFENFADFKNVELVNIEQEGVLTIPNFKYIDNSNVADRKYGVSEKHVALTETFYNVSNYIEIEKNTVLKEPIYINMKLDENNKVLLDKTTIVAGESAKGTVVIKYSGELGEQNAIINIFAEANANVEVIVIQDYAEGVRHYFNGLSLIERDARVLFNKIDVGGSEIMTDYSSYLIGNASRSDVRSLYFGDKYSKLDISYNTYHVGMASESMVSVNGALKDDARKAFRGNLYFERDARKSVGREEEFVILLDETVRAHSIPALLCDEDDVIGEHAASAGQIDANKLFYLMSRGLSEADAKKSIVLGTYEESLKSIPSEELREGIEEKIAGKLEF